MQKKRGAARIISFKTSQYRRFWPAFLACMTAQLVEGGGLRSGEKGGRCPGLVGHRIFCDKTSQTSFFLEGMGIPQVTGAARGSRSGPAPRGRAEGAHRPGRHGNSHRQAQTPKPGQQPSESLELTSAKSLAGDFILFSTQALFSSLAGRHSPNFPKLPKTLQSGWR
jgi:hypothetical protein